MTERSNQPEAAELSNIRPTMTDTTQPAGALPEDFGIPTAYRRQSRHYANAMMRTLMAERDAAREDATEWKEAAKHNLERRLQALAENNRLLAERDALRRELEELRARPIPSDARKPDCTDGDGHFYAAVSKAHATPEQNAAVEASIERVAAFARAGREPLTEAERQDAWRSCNQPFLDFKDFCAGIDAAERAHGITAPPVGTSADGETQP
jgi:hypothetical protein